MKKTLLCICALTAALALAACGGGTASPAPASSAAPASVSEAASASEPESASQAADYTAYSIQFDVPEGFEQVDATGTGAAALYQAADGSSINVVITDNPGGSTADQVTLEDLQGPLEDAFSQQYGEDVFLLDVAFESGTMGPLPYYRMDYSVTLAGTDLYQTGLGISADRAYTITYTDTTYGSWRDAFEASIASITPVENGREA